MFDYDSLSSVWERERELNKRERAEQNWTLIKQILYVFNTGEFVICTGDYDNIFILKN